MLSNVSGSERSFTMVGRVAVVVLAAVAMLAGVAGATDWKDKPRFSPLDLPRSDSLGAVVGKASTSDPVGDTFGGGAVQLDINGFSASAVGGELVITISFAGGISAPDSGQPNAAIGFIDLDTDQDGSTGDVPWVDFTTGMDLTGMGNEYYVDLFDYRSSDSTAAVVDDVTDMEVGRADVQVGAQSLTVGIPLALISDDGLVNTATIIGTESEPTDIAPNQGSLASDVDETAFTLQGGRFSVQVAFTDFDGGSGFGEPVVTSNDSAVLYFFEKDNWEMLIKIINGCPLNDRYWVFFAATTNVEFTVTVTDTEAGVTKEYFNPLRQPADAVTDTRAFATCP